MRLQLTSLSGVLTLVASSAMAQVTPGSIPATPVQANKSAVPTPPAATTPPTVTPSDTTVPPSTAPGQAQTTPGQASQLTPAVTGQTPSGQATGTAVTGQTPSAQATGTADAGQLTAATSADVKAGVSVYDQKGGLVGKVESVGDKGAVVNTGKARAQIPIASFAKSGKGLVLALSKAELDVQGAKTTTTTKTTTKTAPKKPK
ncbi:MAG: hypothetical protein ACJ8FT_06330 [Sphingomonas sp.]